MVKDITDAPKQEKFPKAIRYFCVQTKKITECLFPQQEIALNILKKVNQISQVKNKVFHAAGDGRKCKALEL